MLPLTVTIVQHFLFEQLEGLDANHPQSNLKFMDTLNRET